MTDVRQPNYAAVLFDCDGVLVDSESIATRALHRSLINLGLEVTEEAVGERFTGHSFPTCVAMIEADIGGPIPAEFSADNARYFDEVMRRELNTMEGIEAALDALHLPYAVVTNSRCAELAMKLDVVGLSDYFPVSRRFDAETLGVAKPDPAIYQRAAESLGVDIRDCLVIEDSLPGLTAACAAGAHVWAYRPAVDGVTLARLAVNRNLAHWREFMVHFSGPVSVG
ncbi:MAG: HAD family phosphatase [Natronospirillum sp.]